MILRKTKVSPSVNFLVKSKFDKRGMSKFLRHIFIFFQVVFALDSGFIQTTTPRKKMLIKLYALLQSFFMSAYAIYGMFCVHKKFDIWAVSVVAIYFIFSLILISCKYSYYDFQTDLHSFDKEIYADHLSYRLDLKIIANFIVVLLYLILKSVLIATLYPSADTLNFTYISKEICVIICILGVDFVRIIYILVFSSACWRIKKFIEFVKRDNVDVVACQYLYKNIADIIEKAKANFNLVFIVTLIYNTASITLQLFLPFAGGSVKNESVLKLSSDIITVVKNLLIMLAPTFTAGLLASEVEKLVLALRDKVLVAKDEKQRVDIRRFIGYIEARPLKFTICGVVPLDWNLPVIVVNMSFTYLIVMIQFTHKY